MPWLVFRYKKSPIRDKTTLLKKKRLHSKRVNCPCFRKFSAEKFGYNEKSVNFIASGHFSGQPTTKTQCLMENKFFTFLDPILGLIDDGAFFRKPFRWLYTLLAALNLLVPIGVLVAAIDNHVFNAGCKFVVAFIVLFLIICGLSWFGFQIWWNRRDKVNASSQDGDDSSPSPFSRISSRPAASGWACTSVSAGSSCRWWPPSSWATAPE